METRCEKNNCDKDYKYGMNEDFEYFSNCKQRQRNKGLFIADQVIKIYLIFLSSNFKLISFY